MKWLIILTLLIKFNQPHIVAVDLGVMLPIQTMDGLTVPTQDDTLGLIDGYTAIVFVAHDNLAGNHIKDIIQTGYANVIYSDGTIVKYHIHEVKLYPGWASAQYVYNYNGLIFQTCYGKERLVIEMEQ